MTTSDDTARLIETEFEMNEQVFVPAGDGEPAQWKRKGDLQLDELQRYAQGVQDAAERQMERAKRYGALLDEVLRRAGGNEEAVSESLLSREEVSELGRLDMIFGATGREQDRRRAAIARDIAAGRYRALPGTKA